MPRSSLPEQSPHSMVPLKPGPVALLSPCLRGMDTEARRDGTVQTLAPLTVHLAPQALRGGPWACLSC